MYPIAGPGATAGNEFTEGDPFLGTPGTIVTAAWANSIQREFLALLAAGGIIPDVADDAQVLQAIEAISASAASAALSDKLVQRESPQWRRESDTARVLWSSAEVKSPFNSGIEVGATSGPPVSSPKNTLLDNGYDGTGTDGSLLNQQDGHLWPYQCFAPQMQGDSSVADGFFPACLDGQGLNHYGTPQFLTLPGMLGGHGGRIRYEVTGLLKAFGAGPNYRMEVVLTRNIRPAWNSGDGGEVSNAGTFGSNRTQWFLSPEFNSTQFSTDMLCRVELELVSYFHRQTMAFCRFYACDFDGDSAPLFDETRCRAFSYAVSVTLAESISPWNVYFKVDGDTGGFAAPLTVCNTPFGGPGTTPPQTRQDGLGAYFNMLQANVLYFPAPS